MTPNPNTNPKTLTTLSMTLTDPQDAFESFCVPVFCDFIRNYRVPNSDLYSLRINLQFSVTSESPMHRPIQ